MAALSNRYQIERKFIIKGNARSGKKIKKVLFLVAHETANANANADNHFTHFNNNQPRSSAHTFIDENKVLEIVPLDEKAWHVNYDKPKDNQLFGADANDAAIGVELCRPGNFAKAYDRYVWYFAYLCRKFGLNPQKHIVSHKTLDPERRSDPESWLNPNGVTWANFIAHVTDYYNRWHVDENKPATPADSADGKLVRGERGPNVQLLNQMLHTLEYTFKTDDLFDQYTEAALKVFQQQHGLTVDAIYTSAVGEVMLKAIADKQIKANVVKVDPLPTKAPEMIRLAKLIDTTNPDLMRQLKEQGYYIVDTPK